MLKPFTEKLVQSALVLHIGGIFLMAAGYVFMAYISATGA